MLIFNREINNKWLIIVGAILAGILLLVILSIPSCQKPPVTPIATINTLQTELEKPLLAQIAEQEKKIADYKSRLIVSDGKYQATVKKYNDLKREIANVQPPKTNEERRARYTAAGFPPAVPIR